ncbi:MAG: hypothetical protein ACI4SE_09950 [Lachnospiraceae bacterium]
MTKRVHERKLSREGSGCPKGQTLRGTGRKLVEHGFTSSAPNRIKGLQECDQGKTSG